MEVASSSFGNPEHTVNGLELARVGRLLEEWRDWNAGYSWKSDAEQYLSEVFELGDDPRAARVMMDRIYDSAVRRWRAAGHEHSLQ